MKRSAIQFALYLHLHPARGLDQWQLMRTLPQGMSELVQTAASGRKRTEMAEQLNVPESSFKEALIRFLQLVLSEHQKNPYRGLAVRDQASLETCTKHKKLLQNIFHPDKFQDETSDSLIHQINASYEQIQQMQPQQTVQDKPVFSEPRQEKRTRVTQNYQSTSDFQVNHSPQTNTAHRQHQQKKQVNYILVAGVTGLALLGLLIVLIVPSNPQEMVRQDILPSPTTAHPSENIILAGSVNTASASKTQPREVFQSITPEDHSRIQYLLNEFEHALEADLIAELLSTTPPPQSSKQIMKLFTSATQKKVFLHNFSWKQVPEGFYGEGEFLARFEFSDKQQWVTRSGKSAITLSDKDTKLLIEQFHFEDNLH